MPKTIIIAEHHSDFISRYLVRKNMTLFKKLNYSYIGFEHDFDKNIDFEIASLCKNLPNTLSDAQAGLKNLSLEESRHISDMYQSDCELLALLQETKKHELNYYGLDIILGDRFAQTRHEILSKSNGKMEERNLSIANNILNKHHDGLASINIIGHSHLIGIQNLFIEQLGKDKAQNEFLYICPLPKLDPISMQAYKHYFDSLPLQNFLLDDLKHVEIAFDSLMREMSSFSLSYGQEVIPLNCCQQVAHFVSSFFHSARPDILKDEKVVALANKKNS